MYEGGIIAGFYGIGMYYNNTRLENKAGWHKHDDLYPVWSK